MFAAEDNNYGGLYRDHRRQGERWCVSEGENRINVFNVEKLSC